VRVEVDIAQETSNQSKEMPGSSVWFCASSEAASVWTTR